MNDNGSKMVPTTLTKQDVLEIHGVICRKLGDDKYGPEAFIVYRWPQTKVGLLKGVALAGFDIREAAERLLEYWRNPMLEQNPEQLAPLMQVLETACRTAKVIESGGTLSKEQMVQLVKGTKVK